MKPTILLPSASLLAFGASAHALEIPHEQYQLDNGLNVILHKDTSLPQVVINIWYNVGSKDEQPGRSGFAHLFEHLMFMGTTRLPGSGFDDLMESHGGWNNAWTSEDATDYYSVGPSNLTRTFLWMEADRMEGLGKAMTTDKLNIQRGVVRNERRQTHEDQPYGGVWLELPRVLYPEGHPYAHSVIGSHEDLQAATLEDVISFFDTWYVPSNASLVVAGDFDEQQVKEDIQTMFGAIPPFSGMIGKVETEDVDTPVQPLTELTDQVQIPLTVMAWHTPASLQPGDADLDLVAAILADGRASRLYNRLVHTDQTALEVSATQWSQHLSSVFIIEGKPTPEHTIEEMEATIMEELTRLAEEGPTDEELERAKNQTSMSFLRNLENLRSRASILNRYHVLTGEPDYLEKDLERYRVATKQSVQAAAATLNTERLATLRVRPEPTPTEETKPVENTP